jgi:hypothetical protein
MIRNIQLLDRHAGHAWDGDIVSLRKWLSLIFMRWQDMTGENGDPCPIAFTEKELQEFNVEEEELYQYEILVDLARRGIGIPPNGWVASEGYDSAVAKNAEYKKLMLDNVETEDNRINIMLNWPIQDKDEV